MVIVLILVYFAFDLLKALISKVGYPGIGGPGIMSALKVLGFGQAQDGLVFLFALGCLFGVCVGWSARKMTEPNQLFLESPI